MVKTRQFTATSADYAKYNGLVTVLRPLTKAEADSFDVGPMFKCKTANGDEFDAFEDELS